MIKGKFRLPGWMMILSKIGEGKTYSHQVYKSIDISESYITNEFKQLRNLRFIELIEENKQIKRHRITELGYEVLERVNYLIKLEEVLIEKKQNMEEKK